MNINMDLLRPIVELVFGSKDLAESFEPPLPSAPDELSKPAEPDNIEWVETGMFVRFWRLGRSFPLVGLVIATWPETQVALIQYYNPGDERWYIQPFGVESIYKVIGMAV